MSITRCTRSIPDYLPIIRKIRKGNHLSLAEIASRYKLASLLILKKVTNFSELDKLFAIVFIRNCILFFLILPLIVDWWLTLLADCQRALLNHTVAVPMLSWCWPDAVLLLSAWSLHDGGEMRTVSRWYPKREINFNWNRLHSVMDSTLWSALEWRDTSAQSGALHAQCYRLTCE